MISKEDLDHCLEVYMHVYSALKLCVDFEGARTYYTNVLGSLMCGMAIGKHPLSYREPPRTP